MKNVNFREIRNKSSPPFFTPNYQRSFDHTALKDAFSNILKNMKMSSSLSKIFETGINVFKSNSQIMKNFDNNKNGSNI